MLNKIFIMGRLTKEPEMRATQSGVAVASFTMAVDRDHGGTEKKTDFINCVAWRQGAEFIDKYFHKGSMAIVEGRLESRKWTDRDGKNRTEWEVQVDSVHFGESKRQSAPDVETTFEEVSDDGDLPF